nr:MAG TPA: hypothetical protein [Caudoviricetes sp.]
MRERVPPAYHLSLPFSRTRSQSWGGGALTSKCVGPFV